MASQSVEGMRRESEQECKRVKVKPQIEQTFQRYNAETQRQLQQDGQEVEWTFEETEQWIMD